MKTYKIISGGDAVLESMNNYRLSETVDHFDSLFQREQWEAHEEYVERREAFFRLLARRFHTTVGEEKVWTPTEYDGFYDKITVTVRCFGEHSLLEKNTSKFTGGAMERDESDFYLDGKYVGFIKVYTLSS